MNIRHIGAGLLFLSCFAVGLYISYRHKRKAAGIKLVYRLLMHLQSEIVYNRAPLPECFLSFCDYHSEKQRRQFASGDYRSAFQDLELDKENTALFLPFFERLGAREFHEETEHLDLMVKKAKTIFEESEKEIAGKRRVSSAHCCFYCSFNTMEITLLLKVIGMGILVAVAHQILSKTGRDELATWVSVAGILLILAMLIGKVGELFTTIRNMFGL